MDKTTDHAAGPGGRQLKARVRDILTFMEMDEALDTLYQMPLRRVINPLFSFLYAQDHLLRWRAVTALGRVTARLADEDREAARVVIRRFMWNLNDESGGIGWGSPEAMGETLASHGGLAEEFASILLSYAREDGNYLEYEMLHPGLLWGIARLAGARPHLFEGAARHLMPYLESEDPAVRGLAAKIMGLLKVDASRSALERLTNDEAVFQLWEDHRIVERRVGEEATRALRCLAAPNSRG